AERREQGRDQFACGGAAGGHRVDRAGCGRQPRLTPTQQVPAATKLGFGRIDSWPTALASRIVVPTACALSRAAHARPRSGSVRIRPNGTLALLASPLRVLRFVSGNAPARAPEPRTRLTTLRSPTASVCEVARARIGQSSRPVDRVVPRP